MAAEHARFELADASPRARVAALACLLVASVACTEPSPTSGWEGAQARYAKALKAEGQTAPDILVREVSAPRAAGPERCVSCHLGMAPELHPLENQALFRSHPRVAHAPEDFGCVACHGGRADGLTRAGAHGTKDHGPEPLLPLSLVEARCGSCHRETGKPAPVSARGIDAPTLLAGEAAFHELGCRGCHRVDELGGRLARDLTSVGTPARNLLNFGRDLRPGTTWNKVLLHHGSPLSIGPIGTVDEMTAADAERLRAMQTYLLSLRGADANAAGARAFATDGAGLHAALCSACHGADGKGRDWTGRSQWSPGLTTTGHASLSSRRFLREVVTGGRPLRGMPAWQADRGGLEADEIETLLDWLESQHPSAAPLETLLAGDSDADRGRVLFAQACAACHGDEGRGGDFGGSLRGLPLEKQHAAVTLGRPDAGMPPYAAFAEQELRDLFALLQVDGAWRPEGAAATARTDPRETSLLYVQLCANCHGPRGEGREGPSFRSEDWQRSMTDAQITMAILTGRPGAQAPGWTHAGETPLSAREALSLTPYLRGLRGPVAAPGTGTKR